MSHKYIRKLADLFLLKCLSNYSLLLVALLILGIALLPLEKERSSFLNEKKITQTFWKTAGASSCAAALSGFRGPLAAWLWLEAFTAWEKKEWNKMADLLEAVLLLEPHQILYYRMAAWHMAWNASCDAAKQHDETLCNDSIQRGRIMLEEGIRNNPQSSLLYEYLGVLLRDKCNDHAGASAAFVKAAMLPGAHLYLRRFAAYELAECPGHEAEAYAELRALYEEGSSQRVPALIVTMKRLEEKLRKEIHRDGSDGRD